MDKIYIWKITCGLLNVFLPDLYIKANSFDTALKIARNQDQRYDTGQVYKMLHIGKSKKLLTGSIKLPEKIRQGVIL